VVSDRYGKKGEERQKAKAKRKGKGTHLYFLHRSNVSE